MTTEIAACGGPNETRWQKTQPARFRHAGWRDEVSGNVYDLRSGNTHCLSPLALELLDLLTEGRRGVAELATELRDVFHSLDDASSRVQAELNQMQKIGLIENLN